MSNRNGRRAAPVSAVKAAKGRRASVASSSTFDLSSNDNDNYSGVDDISDDEDDDEDVFAVEEEAIMGESSPSPPSTPRPHSGTADQWMPGDNDDESDDDNDEESGSVAANDPADDDVSWPGINSDAADVPTSDFFDYQSHFNNPRRVRFDVPSDDDGSSSESTEDDHAEMYPDIFVDQSTLDPSFRRQIENELDESSASDSFWDHTALYNGYFENDSEADTTGYQLDSQAVAAIAESLGSPNAIEPSSHVDEDMGDAKDLDGYETDGETTEDEEIPDPPIRRKIRRPSMAEAEDSDSDSDGGAPVKRKKDQPFVGNFDLAKLKGKPIAVYDTKKGRMIIFTPDTRNLDLSPENFHATEALGALQWQMGDQMSPLVGNGAGLMFGSLTSNLFMNNPTAEEFEDMFALQSADQSPSMDGESSCPRDSDADPEVGLKVSDFLDLDDGGFSNDEDGVNKAAEPASTPMRPTTASSDADVLSHLRPSTVGAFRRNQVNSQLMIRNQATQDSLDFSGPYNSTAIRGIRSDRFDTAGVPLTPVRRHKKQPSDLTRSPLDAVSVKRKASSEVSNGGHKKQKSISDVGSLQL